MKIFTLFSFFIKNENPDKQYPSNFGKKWSHEEKITLLEELIKVIDIEIISQNHNKTYDVNARIIFSIN